MKRPIALAVLVGAWVLPALAGDELQPRDLTPVTWLEAPKHAPVEVVRDGKARAVVYVADPGGRGNFDPPLYRHGHAPVPPPLPRLIQEMVEVIRLGCGAELALIDRPPVADQPAIVIGDCEESRQAGIDAAQLPPEGFVVKTARNRVYLVGSTQPLPASAYHDSKGSNEGTAWAVADFLERFVGVRWYWPAEYGGRSIPASSSLVIPPAHYRDRPVCSLRVLYQVSNTRHAAAVAAHGVPGQGLLPFAPGVIPDGENMVQLAPWVALLRHGISWPYQSQMHGARSGDLANGAQRLKTPTKPKFSIKADGTENPGLLCYSAPESADYLLETCEQVWNKGGPPPAWVKSTGVVIWWPHFDNPLGCRCPACRAMAENGGKERIMGLFVQRVCEKIKQRWPDKRVVYCMPNGLAELGDLRFPDNLVVHDLSIDPIGLMQQPAVRRDSEDQIRSWRAISGRQVSTWTGIEGPSSWTYGPVQFPHLVQDFYRRNREHVDGSFLGCYSSSIWVTGAPTFYVWWKVLWNPELNVDAALDEMCRRLFGRAAGTARELLRLECDRWEGAQWTQPLAQPLQDVPGWAYRLPVGRFRETWPPEVVARMRTLRDKALTELAGNPDARLHEDAQTRQARQAFLYWTWTFDKFLQEAEASCQTGDVWPPENPMPHEEEYLRLPDAVIVRASPAPRAAAPATVDPQPSGAASLTKINPKDDAEMVLVPAGKFLMGTSEEERAAWLKDHPGDQGDLFKFGDEIPQRTVRLDAYYVYKTEVTVGQYRKFCEATGRAMPDLPGRKRENDRNPIANVSWDDAMAYADWAGAALPTEAEWEKAARGGDRRVFPWGNAWPPPAGAGNFGDADYAKPRLGLNMVCIHDYADGFTGAAPTGSFAPNPYGLHDLAGNMREWCADWYGETAYKGASKSNPKGPATGVWHVARGGSWFSGTPWSLRAAYRGDYRYLPIRSYSTTVGFRCVVRAP